MAHPRTPLETVIDALAARGKKPRGNDRGWTALCPAHDDSTPSLSVGVGADDRVLIHCHAGCDQADILAALDLTLADLFAGPRTNGTSDTIATYDYVDETGNLLFQVVRKPGKKFVQRRPDGAGGWIWKLGDTRRVLYRLPQVIDAIANEDTVFIVEGEKDVDRLAAEGYVATTNPHGAGKWRADYNATLQNAVVVIVADKDTPGLAHARDIARHLNGIVTSIRIVEAAHGKDISDHLAAGLTVEELIELDDEDEQADEHAPKWAALIIDGKTWLTSGPDTAQPLWGTETVILAALDQPTTIAGPQGSGKSVFGQRVALGWIGLVTHILGIPIHPGEGNVLYLASDRPDQARLSMRRMVTDNQLDTLEARMRVWKGPPPEDIAKQPLMLRQMADVAKATLLIIDSVKDVALKLSADEIGAAYNTALQHAVAAGIQILALHHPRKLAGDNNGDQPVRTLDDLYGATWITAGNGSVLYLQPGALDGYTLTQLKSPIGEKAELPYEHDTATGDIRQATTSTLIDILTNAGHDGITAVHAARCLYRVDRPEEKQRKRVARALNDYVDEGIAETFKVGPSKRWRAVE